jgi:hypothetical protein
VNLIDEFFKLADKEFQFLIDEFGYKKKAKQTDAGVYRRCYENRTTNVAIRFDWREQYIHVLFGRRDRNPPRRPEDEMVAFDLEDLLKLRTGRHAIDLNRFGKALTRRDVKQMISAYARALRRHAGDVLQGDFAVFPALEKIVRKRMKDHAVAQAGRSGARGGA